MAIIDEDWKSSPADYRIDPDTVHVWRGVFRSILLSNREFAENLSKEEMERAQRFVRHSDRERYIFAHALVRSILGAYLRCEPRQLIFNTNKYGKPCLVSPRGSNEIRFNLSHSHDMALIAVTKGIEVGIDIEHMRTVKDAHQIVNRFFSIHERQFLNSLPPVQFNEAFFDCWTSKEAFLKGLGKGLSYPLDRFSIMFSNRKPFGLISIDDEQVDAHCWNVVRIFPGPGYAGALATRAFVNDPRFFEYCVH